MPFVAAKPAGGRENSAGIFHSPAKRTLIACLLLTAITLATYSSLSRNGFVNFDDDRYVLTNAHVQAGLSWATIRWAFTSFDEANWFPLTWLSLALDCQLFGLHAAGHHLTSLLFHVANVLLLFLLLRCVTRSSGRSLMVAALFAVHPINVESVAWMAERKSVLAMLFFLLALGAYGWYARKPGVGRYLVVVTLFAMGLMSKPTVITLPFALLLLDYWPLGRLRSPDTGSACAGASGIGRGSVLPFWRLCFEKIPLLTLSAASAVITVLAQTAGGAVTSTATHPPLMRLENAIVCYVLYIAKAFWPSHLSVLYPYPRSLPPWEVIASALFLLIATAAVVKYREHRYLPVGWFWFLGTMVPMIGLVQVGNQAMADRYAYLPLIGLFVIVVWGMADWAESECQTNSRIPPKFLAAVSVGAVLALAALAHIQVSYWHDDLSLWTHTLAVTRDNFVAENNMGAILARQGNYEEAVGHFRAASVLEPGDSVSQLNLGIYAQQHGDLKQAMARYELTLHLATDSRIRASAYSNLGQIYYALRDYPRAQENYEAAMSLGKPFPLELGLIAQKTGEWNQAVRYYALAAAAQPSDVRYLLLSQALMNGGREEDAQRAYQQALHLSKDIQQAQQTADKLLGQ